MAQTAYITGKTGSFQLGSSTEYNEDKYKVSWTNEYDVGSNTSRLIIDSIEVKANVFSSAKYPLYPNLKLSLNGVVVLDMDPTKEEYVIEDPVAPNIFAPWATIRLAEGLATATAVLEGIEHDDDGFAEVEWKLTISNSTLDAFLGYPCLNYKKNDGTFARAANGVKSGSGTFPLVEIPKVSTIGATDANIESNSTIVIHKRVSTYLHSVRYSFCGITGYITPDGGTSDVEVKFSEVSVSFAIPSSFYDLIPNRRSANCSLSCKTYRGDVMLAEAQTTEFTITAAEALCRPEISGTVTNNSKDAVDLVGDENTFVRFFSDALCKVAAEAKNSATIKDRKVNGVSLSEGADQLTFNNVEVDTFVFTVTDSRGYSNSVTVKKDFVEYIKLTLNVQFVREGALTGNARLLFGGNYFNGSFGAVENALSLKYRLTGDTGAYGNWVDVVPLVDGMSYSASVPLSGLDPMCSYTAEIACEDKLMTFDREVTVPKGLPVVDWGSNDYRFNVPFRVPNSMFGNELPLNAKKGQVFFLQNGDGVTYSIRIYNGETW